MGIFSKKKDNYAPQLDDMSAKKAEVAEVTEEKTSKSKKGAKADKAAAKSDDKKAARGPLAREGAGDAYRVLVRPVFTEKSAMLQSAGKYVFAVAKDAGKVEIAAAIRDLYGVKPVAVNIVKIQGKKVRFGRFAGKEKDVKKAIVTLKKGDTIAIME